MASLSATLRAVTSVRSTASISTVLTKQHCSFSILVNRRTFASLSPAARHISESRGLDATGLEGDYCTGGTIRRRIVTKSDVLAAIRDGIELPPLTVAANVNVVNDVENTPSPVPIAVPVTSTPSPLQTLPPTPIKSSIPTPAVISTPPVVTSSFVDEPATSMRKVIARRLTESKSTVPHFYTSIEIELDNILALRKNLAKSVEAKVSVNDLILRSCALALRDVPEVNSTMSADGALRSHDNVDVSVAVATPTGLITPIIRNADELGLAGIRGAVGDLAARARIGKLEPEEYQGGTFCVSNLGMFGVDEFSAVVNPPQAAILAVGGGQRRIVPTPFDENDDSSSGKRSPGIRTVMTARLSSDRRVVDEATAGIFLQTLKQYLQKPELLLL